MRTLILLCDILYYCPLKALEWDFSTSTQQEEFAELTEFMVFPELTVFTKLTVFAEFR